LVVVLERIVELAAGFGDIADASKGKTDISEVFRSFF
jgi:hypothetical protein